MTTAETKRQKVSHAAGSSGAAPSSSGASAKSTATTTTTSSKSVASLASDQQPSASEQLLVLKRESGDNFGVDIDDLTDDTDSDDDENENETENGAAVASDDDDEDEDEDDGDGDDDDDDGDILNGKLGFVVSSRVDLSGPTAATTTTTLASSGGGGNYAEIQKQLAAAGPAGVAAAAAIATARKRKRPHSFETNPSVRKRQQTRLIRKLRACIDEYTMRVGQQAVVLITMPGKAQHNFKVFGAQPLEGVIRQCKFDIMSDLERALLEQAPQQFKDDTDKHELPPLVIDGIPTPVEKMTQAQLRAFIPLMLKYSTGRGKPGWGKDSTRPAWWPETLPWANVRSDARDESEKQRISWTTTLRQIVTNCYKFHGRDDLLPTFDESTDDQQQQPGDAECDAESSAAHATARKSCAAKLAAEEARSRHNNNNGQQLAYAPVAAAATTYATATTNTIMHTLSTNPDGTMSLVPVDPANVQQILTLPDGTQVRAVRIQALNSDYGAQPDGATSVNGQQQQQSQSDSSGEQQTISLGDAQLDAEGQIIVTGEDGTQSCYPVSSLVSIPASMYHQFASSGQQLSIVAADGSQLDGHTISIHQLQEDPSQPDDDQGQHVQIVIDNSADFYQDQQQHQDRQPGGQDGQDDGQDRKPTVGQQDGEQPVLVISEPVKSNKQAESSNSKQKDSSGHQTRSATLQKQQQQQAIHNRPKTDDDDDDN